MIDYNWADLAFESKKPLSSLKAVFIAAPREMSAARFIHIVKDYLPKGPIILGLAKEDFIDGFEGQPQFKTLKREMVADVIDKVNSSSSKNKIYTLRYQQRELQFILEKIKFSQVLFINGSWHHSFHTLPQYYTLSNNAIPYTLLSPFVDETEAREYEAEKTSLIPTIKAESLLSETEVMQLADQAARQSFDNGFQTGAVLARKTKDGYEYVDSGFNKVLPYQTSAFHHGATREIHFSPVNDLNHYDTIHAEMALLTGALKNGTSLKGLSLFVNLMPCPNCARNLAETELVEIVYRTDHSEGYAVQLFEKIHKQVRRVV